jgi:trigger factor
MSPEQGQAVGDEIVERLQRLPKQQAEMIWNAQGQRMKEDARPMATRQVRISLILEALVEAERIEVTEADLEEYMERMAAEMNSPLKTVKSVFAKGDRLKELEFQLATQKALDKVLAEASYDESTKALSD